MTRRSKIWLVVAVLFSLVNLGGAVTAAMQKELLHTTIHVALLLLGTYLAWQIAVGSDGLRIRRREAAAGPSLPNDLAERLTHLEQSVDAVAIEVERIGEGQRFLTRRFAEQGRPQPANEGGARSSESGRRGSAPSDSGH